MKKWRLKHSPPCCLLTMYIKYLPCLSNGTDYEAEEESYKNRNQTTCLQNNIYKCKYANVLLFIKFNNTKAAAIL